LRKLLAVAVLIAAVFTIPAMAATTRNSTLKDDYFTRAKLTIKKGTTVVWKWNTKNRHTVTEYNGRWGTVNERKKGTFKRKFTKKGKWTVYCLVHPVEMRQRIIVK
jgi:plastocyanin